MLAICDDPSVIGVPFYIMEMLSGIVYTDRTPVPLGAPMWLESGEGKVAFLERTRAAVRRLKEG